VVRVRGELGDDGYEELARFRLKLCQTLDVAG
jgi:hypothetical protein